MSAIRMRTGRIASAAVAATVAGCVLFSLLPLRSKTAYVQAAVWGLAMLGSFVGWGEVVRRLACPGSRVDMGLRAIWGASAVAFLGGIVAAVGLARPAVLIAIVLIGCVALVVCAWTAHASLGRALFGRARFYRKNLALGAVALACVAIVALHYLGAAGDLGSNPYDDDLSYNAIARQLLDTGAMYDPFSFRRASALGAQSVFHAMLLTRSSFERLNLFDRGICIVLIAALVSGFRHEKKRPYSLFITLGLVLALLFIWSRRPNLASNYSGVAFFLGLFRTLVEFPGAHGDPHRRRGLVLVALVASATCALRQSYLPVAGGLVIATTVLPLPRTRAEAKATIVDLFVAGGVSAVALAAWLIAEQRSAGGLLFPLQKGFLRPAFEAQSPTVYGLKTVRLFYQALTHYERTRYLVLFFLVGALVPERDARRPLKCFVALSFVGLAAMANAFTLTHGGNILRYGFGFAAAMCISVVLVAGATATRVRDLRTALIAGLAAIAVFLQFDPANTSSFVEESLAKIDEQRRIAPISALSGSPVQREYPPMQGAVPAGERMFVMVDSPSFLDFERNPIFSLDIPGAMSPPPGMPFFRGAEAFADYFVKTQSLRYFAFVDPERSRFLYRRDFWYERIYNEEELWRLYAPYFLDIFDTVDELARTRRVLYEGDGMFVLDLATTTTTAERVEHLVHAVPPRTSPPPRFGVVVHPAPQVEHDVERIAETGFDFVVVAVSATEQGIAEPDKVGALVAALRRSRLAWTFDIGVPPAATGPAQLAVVEKDIATHHWMDRRVDLDGVPLLFVDVEQSRPPLPKLELPGYDVMGLSRWTRFDKLGLEGGDPIATGYAYLNKSGYAASWAPTWNVRPTRGVSYIVPGWTLAGPSDVVGMAVMPRRHGHTLVEQFDAALRGSSSIVVFNAWNDDANGVSLRAENDAFYRDLAAALMARARGR